MKCEWCGLRISFKRKAEDRVVGLCAECSEQLFQIASRRGIDLNVPPPRHKRQRLIQGTRLIWWRNRWRIEKQSSS